MSTPRRQQQPSPTAQHDQQEQLLNSVSEDWAVLSDISYSSADDDTASQSSSSSTHTDTVSLTNARQEENSTWDNESSDGDETIESVGDEYEEEEAEVRHDREGKEHEQDDIIGRNDGDKGEMVDGSAEHVNIEQKDLDHSSLIMPRLDSSDMTCTPGDSAKYMEAANTDQKGEDGHNEHEHHGSEQQSADEDATSLLEQPVEVMKDIEILKRRFNSSTYDSYERSCPYGETLQLVKYHHVTRRPSKLVSPFRLLYVGPPHFRDFIVKRFKEASLAPSTGDDNANGEKEDLLVVEDCNSTISWSCNRHVTVTTTRGEKVHLRLPLFRNINSHDVEPLRGLKPDLAVFISTRERWHHKIETTNYWNMIEIMNLLKVPAYIISSKRVMCQLYDAELSLATGWQAALERRNEDTGKTAVVDSFAMSLRSFENIPSEMLNRNVAGMCILAHSSGESGKDGGAQETKKSRAAVPKPSNETCGSGLGDAGKSSRAGYRPPKLKTLAEFIVRGFIVSFLIISGVALFIGTVNHFVPDAEEDSTYCRRGCFTGSAARLPWLQPPSGALVDQSIAMRPCGEQRSPPTLTSFLAGETEREDRDQNGVPAIHALTNCHAIIKVSGAQTAVATEAPKKYVYKVKLTRDAGDGKGNQTVPFEIASILNGGYALMRVSPEETPENRFYMTFEARKSETRIVPFEFARESWWQTPRDAMKHAFGAAKRGLDTVLNETSKSDSWLKTNTNAVSQKLGHLASLVKEKTSKAPSFAETLKDETLERYQSLRRYWEGKVKGKRRHLKKAARRELKKRLKLARERKQKAQARRKQGPRQDNAPMKEMWQSVWQNFAS